MKCMTMSLKGKNLLRQTCVLPELKRGKKKEMGKKQCVNVVF